MVRRRKTVRRSKRRAVGGINWKSLLKRGHDYVKSNRLASRGLNALGFNKAGQIASILGYGKRRRGRRVGRRRVRGSGFWDVVKNVGSVATNVASLIPHPGAQTAAGVGRALGLGRRRGRRGRRVGGYGVPRGNVGAGRIGGGAGMLVNPIIRL